MVVTRLRGDCLPFFFFLSYRTGIAKDTDNAVQFSTFICVKVQP